MNLDGLEDELTPRSHINSKACSLEHSLSLLDTDGDRDKLVGFVYDHSRVAADLSRRLADRDIRLSAEVITRHRRGECSWCVRQGRR